jgi:FkbM family methyltransferase
MLKKIAKSIISEETYASLRNSYYRMMNPEKKQANPALLYPHKLEIIEGKLICLDLITPGSTIISGGVGNDVRFELQLIEKKNTKVIGLDPTTVAETFIEREKQSYPKLKTNYTYLKKALSNTNEKIKMFYGENDFMSSISSHHRDAKDGNFFYCEATTLGSLLNEYKNVSYLKIDIEGAEYAILEEMKEISVPQISIEFHHHCSDEYTLEQSIRLIKKIEAMGYDVIDYGAYHGRDRKLPEFVSKWSDLNCELLFIKR